jgi:hypothetical protein
MMPLGMNEMSAMHRSWKRYGLLLIVAILTVTSFAALVHRHIGGDEQGCVMCHVRHEPGIDNPFTIALAVPVPSERRLEAVEIQLQSRDSVPVRSGRAPPASF